ncbi:putative acetyltransferase [Saccharothrix tamanrassetensis]|uniref:Putative acetyltransferase n=1 Tax=Saccharothrix tamanrassetensis TaxID=1051531 RepID=A0A841CAV9_9PSEU|nr:GNAT family N-acetyltransferase [Saccharothrix tamanrassetensis]MBB5954083.1 putative acetyltransferase [Saccharothrix tamanrassetensis]
MTDLDIRVLDDAHYRAAHTLFRGTLHHGPAPDERWEVARTSYEPGRALGAFAGEELVGTAQSFPSRLAVPGGAVVPMAAVSRVGVRADWTRRGALTALQRAQLRGFREAGEVAATLRASEGVIYERFGYGVASRFREVRVVRAQARTRVPIAGRVRLVEAEPAGALIRSLFERLSPGRPGTIARWPGWWNLNVVDPGEGESQRFAVASGPDGDDGYAVFKVTPGSFETGSEKPTVLAVLDLWAASPRAWSDLWAFLLGIDLVGEVVAEGRPVDEPLEWLMVDRRAVRVTDVMDETWLRLVDVEAALSARAYRPGPSVVIGVRDRFLPENEGAYLVGSSGAARTSEAPDFVVDVDVLGAAYLGDVSFGAMAMAGRFAADRPDAVARADALFAVDQPPWCGTFF